MEPLSYEVRDSSIGEGWTAVYFQDDETVPEGPRLICTLPPGHLELLGRALDRARGLARYLPPLPRPQAGA